MRTKVGPDYIARAGTLIHVDQGEYSDYGSIGFFVALKDFAPSKVFDEWRAIESEDEAMSGRCDKLLAWLIGKGLLLEIRSDNLFLGEYDTGTVAYYPSK